MKERHQFGRATAHVLVRMPNWVALLLPTLPRLSDRLIRSGFVLTPDGQSQTLSQQVGSFDQLFFASASGSLTITTSLPRLRRRKRRAVPVSHQVRSSCQLRPASLSTRQSV